MKHNGFQKPPVFAAGSISPDRKTIQVIDEAGDVHDLGVDVALIAIEACQAVERLAEVVDRFGHLEINTPELEEGLTAFEMAAAR